MPVMETPDIVGFVLVLALMGLAGVVVHMSRLSLGLKLVIYAALGARVLGSWLRYAILFEFYDGSGDARLYYSRGLEYADRFLQFDFSPFFDPELWLRYQWWGTSFVSFPSGIVLTGIGPSLLGEFVVFSLAAFLGLVGFAVAFGRTTPEVPLVRYAFWIWLFPSLWYWPSSVGKDALVLMGMGLTIWGFVGKRGHMSWPLLLVGFFLVFAIRPQVAAVLVLALVLGHWFSFGSRWTARKAVQGGVILVAGLGGIWLSMSYIGVEGFDVEGVQTYMEVEAAGAAGGGSAVQEVEVGIGGIPWALRNILTRPFIWEAHNVMALVASLEIMAFWAIVWYRRKNFVHALKNWRSHPLLRIAIPFILVYSITLGMLIVNMGIIARQRIFLFPFLFLLLEALPAPAKERRAAGMPTRRPPPAPMPVGRGMR